MFKAKNKVDKTPEELYKEYKELFSVVKPMLDQQEEILNELKAKYQEILPYKKVLPRKQFKRMMNQIYDVYVPRLNSSMDYIKSLLNK
jgi:anaerobic ribonucleoside-triphosphate reductase